MDGPLGLRSATTSFWHSDAVGGRPPQQEVAWLELSGGVRSLPQVPWWDAERRARRKARAVPQGTAVIEQRLSAFRFPFFLRSPDERSDIRERPFN
jgi:hypothetical protein